MKVVLDTNVLITGFKDEYSYQKRIIDEISAGKIMAYANRQTLRENHLLLNKIIENDEYRRELDTFFAQVEEVENHKRIHIVSDPEDNKILESAVEAQADYLISEDNHLLSIVKFQDVKIVEPGQFWAIYSDMIDGDPWAKWVHQVMGK